MATHCFWSVPKISVHVVVGKSEVLISPVKFGVSSARMMAVPTHGSTLSFFEAL